MSKEEQSYIGPEAILEKRKQYFFPCTAHFYKNPPQIVRGKMQYLYDEQGKAYLDFFAGVSVVACGHCNEQITEKTIEQLKQLQHTTTIYLTQPMVDLAERLANGILPGNLKRTFFCNSGSEANEGAMLLGVTGIPMWRADDYLDTGVTFIPRPYAPDMDRDEAAHRSLDALREVLAEKGDTIAAMIVEPIQGNGGMITPPNWYFPEVKALLEQHGVLLIGFGRTGKMFAMEHYNVVPDIMSMAKALGNGVPIAAFATTDEIAASFNRPSASTFGGNPVSAVTAMAVLDYIEQEKLVERAQEVGSRLIKGLFALQAKHVLITDVRGQNFMCGAELTGENAQHSAQLTDCVLEKMKDRGFIIGKNGVGRNVLAFQPPIIMPAQDVDAMLIALDEVLSECEAGELG